MSFSYQRWICLADTDAAGVVYFTQALQFCHEAYEASLRSEGIALANLCQGIPVILPIVRAEMDYWQPLRLGDCCQVNLQTTLETPEVFVITYDIWVSPHTRAVGHGMTRHVCIDPSTRRRQSLPLSLQTWIERFREPPPSLSLS